MFYCFLLLFKVHRRYEMICNGPKNIVKFISTLQPTEHVPDSFKFDVVFFMVCVKYEMNKLLNETNNDS